MTRAALLRLILALVSFSLVSSARAVAEIVVAPSAEWLMASSDIVVRGKITDVTIALSKNREAWDKVTVKVTETLRGEHQDTIDFVVQQPSGEFSTQHLRQFIGGGDVLLFLVKGDAHKKTGPEQFADVVLTPHEETQPYDLSGKYPFAVPNLEFKAMSRPDDLLTLVQKIAKENPATEKTKRLTVHVPFETDAFRKLWGGSSVLLTAPANPHLEGLAKAWLESKKLEYRTIGVRALGEFKSDANIKLLKSLLASPDSEEITSNGKQLRHYPLRHYAFEALERWGVQVQRPVTDEPRDC